MSASVAMTSGYRADIDGLRSVAVLLVIVYHAGFTVVPGGYIGVDVFFVISGFLITSIIAREVASGEFSFSRFYRRRVLRLMPALFAMLAATSAVAALLLFPSDLVSYAKSAAATATSVGNFFFWREYGGYFGGNAQVVPLLHTWSLAVEEQYYVIWPVLLIFLHRLVTPRQLMLTAVIGLLPLLAFSEWMTQATLGAAYYLLPARAYELGVGSVLALVWNRLPNPSRWFAHLTSVAGILLILFSARMLDDASLFPGINALAPSLGSAFLIYSGRLESAAANRLLAAPVLVEVGRSSYSAYLWHWPIVAFLNYAEVPLSSEISTLIVISSLVAGWLSYRFVEMPFRGENAISTRDALMRLFVAPAATVVGLAAITVASGGIPARFPDDIVAMDRAVYTRPEILRGACHANSRNSAVDPSLDCRLGSEVGEAQRAFLLGDSHGNHFTGFLEELAIPSSITVVDYTLDACLPLFGIDWGRNAGIARVCGERNERGRRFIRANAPNYVILAGRWPSSTTQLSFYSDGVEVTGAERIAEVFGASLRRTLREIVDAGAIPMVLKDNAPAGGSPRCVALREQFGSEKSCDLPRALVGDVDSLLDRSLARIGDEFPSLIVVDPKRAQCDALRCVAIIAGVPLFRDEAHLNDAGSRALGRSYLERFGNPFLATAEPTRP